jgi:hypothetical protein
MFELERRRVVDFAAHVRAVDADDVGKLISLVWIQFMMYEILEAAGKDIRRR